MSEVRNLKVAILGQYEGATLTQALCNTIASWVSQTNGNIEFFVLDGKGFYTQLHQFLSSLGLKDKTTVVGVGDINNNKFNFKEEVFKLVYEPDTKKAYILDENGNPEVSWENIEDLKVVLSDSKYYRFKYIKLCRQVDTALVVWDGQNRTIDNAVTRLKVLNKPVYIFGIA